MAIRMARPAVECTIGFPAMKFDIHREDPEKFKAEAIAIVKETLSKKGLAFIVGKAHIEFLGERDAT